MAIQTSCPHAGCGQKYRVEECQVGQTVVCRSCGRPFAVAAREQPTSLSAQGAETRSPQHQAGAAEKPEKLPERLGRFEIRARLGAGAFGTVYRAHDPVLDREVAIKVPRASALERPELKARFLREPKAAAKLSHPNIVPVFDAGSDGERFYIASAFIEGRTLKAVLEDDPPKLRRTAQIVRQLADALDYAHRMGVIHRDVKPANIMLDAAGQPMLMDFGLARLQSSSEEKLTQDGTVMGTPAYMAPEQADGSLGEVGPAADQYSLGVVLYEMLCGETPFSGPPAVLIFSAINKAPERPRAKDPTLPRDLETICLKAMSKRAGERYASCGEMAEDLRRWLADDPIHARRMGLGERAAKWARRQPVLAALSLVMALLALVATISATGLFRSRDGMARALENTRQQTRIAQSQFTRAEEQSQRAQAAQRLAQEKAEAARRQEELAESALAKLKVEVEAHRKADADLKREVEEGAKVADDLKGKDSKITEASTAMEATAKKIETIDNERYVGLGDDKWKAYVDRLTAADRACARKDYEAARKLLQECPKEHRAWEWNFLRQLAEGKVSPRVTVIRPNQLKISGGMARFSLGDSGWLWVKDPTSRLATYLLPKCELKTQVPASFVAAAPYLWSDRCQFSPDGQTLMMPTCENEGTDEGTDPPNHWIICDLKSNQWLRFEGEPASDRAFSANGKYAIIFRDDRLEIVHLGGVKLSAVETGISRSSLQTLGFDTSGRYLFEGTWRTSQNGHSRILNLTIYTQARSDGQPDAWKSWAVSIPRAVHALGGRFKGFPVRHVALGVEDSRGLRPREDGRVVIDDVPWRSPSGGALLNRPFVCSLSTEGTPWVVPSFNIVVGISSDRKRILTSDPKESTRSPMLWSIDATAAIPALSSLAWSNWRGDYDYFLNEAWDVVAAVPRNWEGGEALLHWQSGRPAATPSSAGETVRATGQPGAVPGLDLKPNESKTTEAYAALVAALGRAPETKRKPNASATNRKPNASATNAAWLRYVDRLTAADRAFAEGDRAAAVAALEQCPEEHRAWEWNVLSELNQGRLSVQETAIRPSKMRIDRGPLRVTVGESAWLWGQPRDSAPAVFALPACQKHGEIPFKSGEHAPLSSFSHQYSPDGNTAILADRDEKRWTILDVHSDQSSRTDWISSNPFSPNGVYAISYFPGPRFPANGALKARIIDLRTRGWLPAILPVPRTFARSDSSSRYVFTVTPLGNRWRLEMWGVSKLTEPAAPNAWVYALPMGSPVDLSDYWGQTVLHLDDGMREDRAGGRPGGRLLLAGKCVYDLGTKSLLWEAPQSTMALGLSPDGLRILARDSNGALAIWNVETRTALPALSFLSWCRWNSDHKCFVNQDWTMAVAVPAKWMGAVEIPSDAALLHWRSAPLSAKPAND